MQIQSSKLWVKIGIKTVIYYIIFVIATSVLFSATGDMGPSGGNWLVLFSGYPIILIPLALGSQDIGVVEVVAIASIQYFLLGALIGVIMEKRKNQINIR